MLTDPKKEQINKKNLLEKIISSQTFSNKEVLKGLLEFIFNASEKGINLREIDIAGDYFKRKDRFIPGDDTIVRVNIHKLRQLLEKYYSDEGKDEKIHMSIPKGTYTAIFDFEKKEIAPVSNLRNIILIFSIVGTISIIINVFFTIETLKNIDNENHPVWGDYVVSKKPVCVILGDPFFYTGADSSGKNTIYRELNINSAEDLTSKNDNSFQRSKYPYFSKNNVLPLKDILKVFSGENKNISIQALSEVNTDNLKNSNQIFIANINSFGFFNQYLEKTSIRIFLNPRKIAVIDKTDTSLYQVPENVGEFYTDYSFLVKIPAPNHNRIVMIGDFHSSGNKGLSGFLLDKLQMRNLEEFANEKYGSFPDYFEMLVKVTSYHYSDVKTELVYFNKLDFPEKNNYYYQEMMN